MPERPLDAPGRRVLRFVDAVGTGAHGVAKVAAEGYVFVLDPADGEPDAAGDRLAGPLDGIAGAPRSSTQTEGGGQLRGEEVVLLPCSLGAHAVGARLGVLQLVVQFGKTSPVLGPGAGIEQFAQVASRHGSAACARCARLAGASCEVENVQLSSWLREQPGQIAEALGILDPHRLVPVGECPEGAVVAEKVAGTESDLLGGPVAATRGPLFKGLHLGDQHARSHARDGVTRRSQVLTCLGVAA